MTRKRIWQEICLSLVVSEDSGRRVQLYCICSKPSVAYEEALGPIADSEIDERWTDRDSTVIVARDHVGIGIDVSLERICSSWSVS
jgi:hypothetical protein